MQGAMAIDYIYTGICGVGCEREEDLSGNRWGLMHVHYSAMPTSQ
jgi:hypothetical protein